MLVQTFDSPLQRINIKAWSIWTIASLFYLYEFLHRVAPSVMVKELSETFNATGAQIGNLSACYYYAYAFMQIPVGLMLDKYGTRILLSFSAIIIAIGSLIFGITDNLSIAQSGRLLIGIGSAFSFASCLKLAANWFNTERFSLLVGLTNLMGTIGALSGGQPLAILVSKHGWRMPMIYGSLISLIFAALIYIYVQDKKPSSYIERKTTATFNFWKTLKYVLSQKQLWCIAIFGCCMVVPIAVLSELWGVDYLAKKFDISTSKAAFISSCTFLGIAVGGPTIGFLADKTNKKTIFMKLGNITAILSTLAIIYVPGLSINLTTVLHFIFGFSTSSMLLCFSLNRSHVPEHAHATAIGFTNSIIMFGSVLFQPLIGYILDVLNTSVKHNSLHFNIEQYQSSFIVLPICQIIAFFILFFIKDTMKARKVF